MANSIFKVHEMINKVGFEFDDVTAKKVTQLAEKAGRLAANNMTQELSSVVSEIGVIFNQALSSLGKEQINLVDMIKTPNSGTIGKLTNIFVSQIADNVGKAITAEANNGFEVAQKQLKELEQKRAYLFEKREATKKRQSKWDEMSGIPYYDVDEFPQLKAKKDIDKQAQEIMLEYDNSLEKLDNAYKKKQQASVEYQDSLRQLKATKADTPEYDVAYDNNVKNIEQMKIAIREYNNALLQASESYKRLMSMASTIGANIEGVNKETLSDFNPDVLKSITTPFLKKYSEDMVSVGSNVTSLLEKTIGTLKKEIAEVDLKISQLKENMANIVPEAVVKSEVDKIEQIEEAYNRLSYKTGINKGKLKKSENIEGALNYVPGTSSLAKLKHEYDKANPERWEQQYQALVKFVREYEAYANSPNVDKERLKSYQGLYEKIKPMAIEAELMLQNILNKANGISLVGISDDGSIGNNGFDDVKVREKVNVKRTELVEQLGAIGSDSTEIRTLEANLTKRKEIFNLLQQENLLTDEIRASYDAVNFEIQEKIALLKQTNSDSRTPGSILDNPLYAHMFKKGEDDKLPSNTKQTNKSLTEQSNILTNIKKLTTYIDEKYLSTGKHLSDFLNDLQTQSLKLDVELKQILETLRLVNESGKLTFDIKQNGKQGEGTTHNGALVSDMFTMIERSGYQRVKDSHLPSSTQKAYQEGLSVAQVLDYIPSKTVDAFFDVQSTAKGKNLFQGGMLSQDVINATEAQLQQLVNAFIMARNHGFDIENGGSNIVYDQNKGFSFYDLEEWSPEETAAWNKLPEAKKNIRALQDALSIFGQMDGENLNRDYTNLATDPNRLKFIEKFKGAIGKDAGFKGLPYEDMFGYVFDEYYDENNNLKVQNEAKAHQENANAINTETQAQEQLNQTKVQQTQIEQSDNDGVEVAEENAKTEAIKQQNSALQENINLKSQDGLTGAEAQADKFAQAYQKAGVEAQNLAVKIADLRHQQLNLDPYSADYAQFAVMGEEIDILSQKLLNLDAQLHSAMKGVMDDKNLLGEFAYSAPIETQIQDGLIGAEAELLKKQTDAQNQLNATKTQEPPPVDDTSQVKNETSAIDEQNAKLKENINLKGQANGQGVVTPTDTSGTSKSTDSTQNVPNGATSAEAGELEAIKAKVLEVTNAVNTKTQAFLDEQKVVKKVTQSEVHAMGQVEKSVTAVRVALNNIQTKQHKINLSVAGSEDISNITSTENEALTKLREALQLTTKRINEKTQAFETEGSIVTKVVNSEINALNRLNAQVEAINTTITTLLGNIKTAQTGAANIVIPQTQPTSQNNNVSRTSSNGNSSELFNAKVDTQFSSLSLMYAQLESVGKLTPQIEQQWLQLWDSLSKVNDTSSLALWKQELAQVKNSMKEIMIANNLVEQEGVQSFQALINITKLYNQMAIGATKAKTPEERSFYEQEANSALVEQHRILQGISLTKKQQAQYDALIAQRQREVNKILATQTGIKNIKKQKQEEAIVVRELVELYEQLGRARAQGDYTTASAVRGEIKTKRGTLSTVDRATDDKFAQATARGEQFVADEANKAATKAQNDALRERQKIFGDLIKLHRELGVFEEKEKSSAVSDSKQQQYRKEIYELYKQISAKEQLIVLTQEEIDLLNQTHYNAGRTARISNAGEREETINKLKGQYAKLGEAQANAEHKGTNKAKERFAILSKEISEKKASLNLTQQELAVLRQIVTESYKRQSSILTKGQQDEVFKRQVTDSRKKAGLTKADSTYNTGANILTSAMGVDNITPMNIVKLQQYSAELQKLKALQEEIQNSTGLVSKAKQDDLKAQTANVQRMSVEMKALIEQHNALQIENAEPIGQNMLGTGAHWTEYKEQLTTAVNAATNGRASIKNFDSATNTLTYTVKTASNEFTTYKASMDQLTGSLVSVRGQTTKTMGVIESIVAKTKQFSYYFTGSMMIYRIIAWFREGITVVQELDKALTELKKVTDATEASYDKFLDTAAKTAKKVGSTIKDVVNSTADWARLGYSMQDAAQMAESTQILMNVSEFDDVSKATDTLISSIQAFKYTAKESMDVVDILNTIGNNYAISTADLATSLTKSSGSLVAANGTLEEAVALTATANTIIQDADVVGTALKTVAMRLRGTSTEEMEEEGLDIDGALTSKSKLQSKIKGLSGVDILTDTGAYKSTYQILSEIADVWKDINDMDQAALLELLAGKRAGSVMSAILQNPDTLKDAFESANTAAGSANKELETYLDSVEGHMKQFTTATQDMWRTWLDADYLKPMIYVGTVIMGILKDLGMLKTILVAIAGAWMLATKSSPIMFIQSLYDSLVVLNTKLSLVPAKITALTTSLKSIVAHTTATKASLDGLTVSSLKQSMVNLQISDTNQRVLLSRMGLVGATDKQVISSQNLTHATIQEAMAQGVLSKEQGLGLMQKYNLLAVTDSLNVSQFKAILAAQGVKQSDQAVLLSKMGLVNATLTQTIAQGTLTTSIIETAAAEGRLTKAQADQLAMMFGLKVHIAEINAARMSEVLANSSVERSERKRIIGQLGLGVSTKILTREEVKNALATKGMKEADQEAILAKLGLSAATDKATFSLKSFLKSMGPMLAITAVISVIKLITQSIDKTTETMEEMQTSFDDLTAQLDATTQELDGIESQLKDINTQIEELQNQGTLSFAEQKELQRLKEQSAELQRQIELKETLQSKQQEAVNHDAVKLANEYKDIGIKSGKTTDERKASGGKTGAWAGAALGTLVALLIPGVNLIAGAAIAAGAAVAGSVVGSAVGESLGNAEEKVGNSLDNMLKKRDELEQKYIEAQTEYHKNPNKENTEAYEKAKENFEDYEKSTAEHINNLNTIYSQMDWETVSGDDRKDLIEWRDTLDKYLIDQKTQDAKSNAITRVFGDEAEGGFATAKERINELKEDLKEAYKTEDDLAIEEALSNLESFKLEGILSDEEVARLRDMGLYLYETEDALKEVVKVESEFINSDLEDVAKDINKISDGLESLKSAFEEVIEEGVLTAKTIKSLKEELAISTTYSDVEEVQYAWREYLKIMMSGTATTEAMNKATEELAQAILKAALAKENGLSPETKWEYVAQLRVLDIDNAEEIVDDLLQGNMEKEIEKSFNFDKEAVRDAYEDATEDIIGPVQPFDTFDDEKIRELAEEYNLLGDISDDVKQDIMDRYKVEAQEIDKVIEKLKKKQDLERQKSDLEAQKSAYEDWRKDYLGSKQDYETYEVGNAPTTEYVDAPYGGHYIYKDGEGNKITRDEYNKLAKEHYERTQKFEELENQYNTLLAEGEKYIINGEIVNPNYQKQIDEVQREIDALFEDNEDLTIDINLKDRVISKASQLEDAFNSLGNAIKEFKEEGIASASTISSLEETFGEFDEFDELFKVLATGEGDVEEAITNVANAYVHQAGFIENLSEEEQRIMIARLEALGAINAEEAFQMKAEAQNRLQTLASFYGVDASNFATAEEAKLAIAQAVGLDVNGIQDNQIETLAKKYDVDLTNYATIAEKKIAIARAVALEEEKNRAMDDLDKEYGNSKDFNPTYKVKKAKIEADYQAEVNAIPSDDIIQQVRDIADNAYKELKFDFSGNKIGIGSDYDEEIESKAEKEIEEAWEKLVKKYENRLALLSNERDLIQAEIDKAEALGGKASAKYYEDLIELSGDEKDLLAEKKKALEEYLAANGDLVDQDTWTDMNNEINETAVAIKECTTNLIEYYDALEELDSHYFEQASDDISRLGEEIEFVQGLLEGEDIADENGNWTSAGVTSLGLYVQEMERAAASAELNRQSLANVTASWEAYQKLLSKHGSIENIPTKELDKLYDSYGYVITSAEEYKEKSDELTDAIYDEHNAYESAKDGIVELNEARVDAIKDGIQKEIDAYEELIQLKKDELDAERDLHDFKNSIEEKTSNISSLQRRIASLSGSTDDADIAERRKLEAELIEAQKDRDEAYYDHAKDAQMQALDDEQEAYNEAQDEYIERLEEMLEDTEALISNSILDAIANADVILNELTGEEGIVNRHGIALSAELRRPWDEMGPVIAEWKQSLSDDLSSLTSEDGAITLFSNNAIQSMNGIETSWNESAGKIIGKWDNVLSKAKEYTDFLTSSELSTNLTKTLTGFGTEISKISSYWNGVKTAADKAYQAQVTAANVGGNSSDNGGGNSGDSSTQSKRTAEDRYRDDIMALQNALNIVFNIGVGVDGIMGKQTRSAIKRAQEIMKKKGHYSAVIDGGYTPATRNAMIAYINDTIKNLKNSSYGSSMVGQGIQQLTEAKNRLPLNYYAKGTLSTKKDQFSITDEPWLGDELVLVPTASGNLSYMRRGTGVVPADLTKEIFDIANVGLDGLMKANTLGTNINMISNAISKPEFNLSFEALVKAERIDQDTLPEVKKFVQQEVNSLVRQMNYALKGVGSK